MSVRLAKAKADRGKDRWIVIVDDHDVRELPTEMDLAYLLARPSAVRRQIVDEVAQTGRRWRSGLDRLSAPIDDDTEVWAAGVTYEMSRDARIEESADGDVYARVYDAERPELFFKAIGWRVSGPHAPIGTRADSSWDVPEPELALVVDSDGVVAGYTICNDVSSRSIEGANPLYLPQAKIFRGCCAIGPWIVPEWELGDVDNLAIRLRITRDGAMLWSGETSTSKLHRTLTSLVEFLYRGDVFPHGVILATGTCVVPPTDVSLTDGDVVVVDIDKVGELVNPVRRGMSAFAPLRPRCGRSAPTGK